VCVAFGHSNGSCRAQTVESCLCCCGLRGLQTGDLLCCLQCCHRCCRYKLCICDRPMTPCIHCCDCCPCTGEVVVDVQVKRPCCQVLLPSCCVGLWVRHLLPSLYSASCLMCAVDCDSVNIKPLDWCYAWAGKASPELLQHSSFSSSCASGWGWGCCPAGCWTSTFVAYGAPRSGMLGQLWSCPVGGSIGMAAACL